MTKKIIISLFIVVLFIKAEAQQLLTPSFTFSHKKTSYITLTDGTEIKGTLKKIDRKKGLITYVRYEDENGKKHKLKATDVKYMYLPPSGLDKLGKRIGFFEDIKNWTNDKLDQDFLNQGLIYFENSQVKVKKKKMTLLMQLLNPSFSKKVKVYHDPRAKETASIGIAGLTLAGGYEKSYFISIDGSVANKVEKKRYKKEFGSLWSKCNTLAEKYPKVSWYELVKHIMDYSECN